METIIYVNSKDGTPIGCRISGTGPTLLLVHGGTADHRRWAGIWPRFEQHFSVYAMDRRGRGMSGDSPEYNLFREVEDVAAVVEAAFKRSGEPVSVLGHSFGGLCSLEAALLSDTIGQLILYEPPLPVGQQLYQPDFSDRVQALIDQGRLEPALEMFLREEVKMPEHELAIYRRLPMWPERVKIVHTVLREIVIDQTYRFDPTRFADLRVPTLLLLGSDSPPIFRQAIETLESALPASRVAILPGQQHIAMDTAPDLFVREVLAFLESKG